MLDKIMMTAALKLMIKHCQEKLDEGDSAPYWAHKRSAQNVLDRLYDNTFQTSGNNFSDRDE
jgi:hypothetical protein